MPALVKKEYCTGCTACASVCPKECITMDADENGFLHPNINESYCISCGLCEKVCPIINPLSLPEKELEAIAAYTLDETVRLKSSSGGIFTEIAQEILGDNGVVFGAAYNDKFEVIHICAENETELAKLRGAKYAQSDLNGTFKNIKKRLETGQKVLFSGTPCQVGGLKSYLNKGYDNLFTVDFVCHSVPSPLAWREYVKYRAEKDNKGSLPIEINLRSKNSGWSRYQYSNLFEYKDGVSHSAKSSESLYMKLFVGGYISRESCSNCRFKGYSHISDLTIGDFWGVWDILPEIDDNKGTSLVFVQSDKGKKLLEKIGNAIVTKSVSLEEASRQNQAIIRVSQKNAKSDSVFNLIRSSKISECESLFNKTEVSIVQKIKNIIKRLVK